jgi:CubicO group peptidase (beta-lactamase class C family)
LEYADSCKQPKRAARCRLTMADQLRRLAPRLLTGLVAASLWGIVNAASSDATHLSADRVTQLVEELDQIRQAEKVPAMGLAVVTSDRVLFAGALGVVDLDTGKPTNGESRFRIGSITKAFDGLLALRLAERGKLNLDVRVDHYLDPTPFANPWADEQPVLFSHTLEHTAGLTDMTWDEFKFSDPSTPPLATTLYLGSDQRHLQWPAGLHASYSNVGSGVAGRIMEMATGRDFESLMRDEVFRPLGLHTATLLLDNTTKAHLVAGYDTDGVTPIRYWHMLFRPFGAINITPKDMASFIQLWLNNGEHGQQRYLSEASIRRIEQPQTTVSARAGLTYGYGFGNYSWYRRGFLFHGHGGDGDGYLAHFGYQRELGVGYFVVVNVFRHAPLKALRAHLEDALIAGQTKPASVPRASLQPGELRAITGTYAPATWRFAARQAAETLRITMADDGLFKQLGDNGRRRRLIPVTATQFRHSNEPAATMAIVRTSEGDIIFQGDLGNFIKVDNGESVTSNAPEPSSPALPNR